MRAAKIFPIIPLIFFFSQNIISADYSLPDDIYFAGQRVPLEFFDVGERLTRVFNVLVNDRRGAVQNMIAQKNDFLPYSSQILENYGIHPDFAYIIPVESEFNPRALSQAGASGPWQLMPATGRMYGLRVDNFVDERNLLDRSSAAAAEHLNMLSKIFKEDPFLVLAAYNNGDSNVRSTLQSQKTSSFWESRSNSETELYVEKVIVYKLVLENPAKYGFDRPGKISSAEYETCVISLGPKDLGFSEISRIAGISYRELYRINPHIKFGSYKQGGQISRYTSLEIMIPKGSSEILISELRNSNMIAGSTGTIYERGEQKLRSLDEVYEVKYNDRIESIAFKYGADWRELAEINDLEIIPLSGGSGETARIHKGQMIRIVR